MVSAHNGEGKAKESILKDDTKAHRKSGDVSKRLYGTILALNSLTLRKNWANSIKIQAPSTSKEVIAPSIAAKTDNIIPIALPKKTEDIISGASLSRARPRKPILKKENSSIFEWDIREEYKRHVKELEKYHVSVISNLFALYGSGYQMMYVGKFYSRVIDAVIQAKANIVKRHKEVEMKAHPACQEALISNRMAVRKYMDEFERNYRTQMMRGEKHQLKQIEKFYDECRGRTYLL